jgi:tRNA(Ile)-lysidine synthase
MSNGLAKMMQTQAWWSPQDRLLLACSGGVDSMVLLHLLVQSKANVVVAHCNFQLRGAESERDENFVSTICKASGIECLTQSFDTAAYAATNKISIQLAARQLRYQWFEQLLAAGKANWLLTAHHQDDQVETVLMHFFRGTGINGLAGIKAKQQQIIRPLLNFAKSDLLQYAQAHQLQWEEDSSNEQSDYTRNFFRHEVIPVVGKVFANAVGNAANSIEHLQEAHTIYEAYINTQTKKLLEKDRQEQRISILKLQQQVAPNALLLEILQPFGFSPAQTSEVLDLCLAQTGKAVYSATHVVFKNRKWLVIAALAQQAATQLLIDATDKIVLFAHGKLQFEAIPQPANLNNNNEAIAIIDSKALEYPLLLRPWKTGDYCYPLGMGMKKKKLSRFFVDKKLSKTEKEKIWVLESNRKIVWVIGQRIDERFKVKPGTTDCCRIEWTPTER